MRQHRVQEGQAVEAGVHVERDVVARGPRAVHRVDAAGRVIGAAARRQVGDLQPGAGGAGRADRFLNRSDCVLVPIAGVGRVEPAAPGRGRRQRGDLGLAGALLGGVLQAGRIAPGPGVHALFQEVRHGRQLGFAGRAVLQPHGSKAQLAIGHQRHDVDRRPSPLQPLQVRRGRGPVDRHLPVEAVDDARRQRPVLDREAAVPAVADHLGGHALVHGAHRPRIDQQRVVGVAVDVDEARRDVEPARVDLHRRRCTNVSDLRHAAAADRDIRLYRRGAGAVEHQPAANDEFCGARGTTQATLSWCARLTRFPYRSQKKRTHSGARSIACSSYAPLSGLGQISA